jgi:hypothetical protein
MGREAPYAVVWAESAVPRPNKNRRTGYRTGMEGAVVFNFLLLIGAVVFVVATLLGTLPRISYMWSAAVGVFVGLGLWVAAAIAIYRGPDNPDFGEDGWTIVVGVLLGMYVVVWLLGAAVGRALRGRTTRDDRSRPNPRPRSLS